jgi:S1-C subfamily serine protease
MENQNRVAKALLLLAGFVLVLCVGMAVGGAIVYGVMQISSVRSDVQVKTFGLQLDDLPGGSSTRVFTPEVVVVEVLPGTPAERAGLQEGDLILAVDGQRLGPEADLAILIAGYEPRDRVTLEVQQPGQDPRRVRVVLGENPEQKGVAYLGIRYSSSAGSLPGSRNEEFDIPGMPILPPGGGAGQAVVVVQVTEGSPAAAAGLNPGDLITAIDGEPLDSSEALTKAIARRQPGDRVTLSITSARGGDEREVEVRLGEHPDQEGKAYLGVQIGGSFRWKIVPHSEGGQLPHGSEFGQGGPFFFGIPEGVPLDKLPFDLGELPLDHKEFERELERHFEFFGLPQPEGDSL